MTATARASLTDNTIDHVVCDLLATNYHVDPSAISHPQLLTADHSSRIISAALDRDTLRASLKKPAQPPDLRRLEFTIWRNAANSGLERHK